MPQPQELNGLVCWPLTGSFLVSRFVICRKRPERLPVGRFTALLRRYGTLSAFSQKPPREVAIFKTIVDEDGEGEKKKRGAARHVQFLPHRTLFIRRFIAGEGTRRQARRDEEPLLRPCSPGGPASGTAMALPQFKVAALRHLFHCEDVTCVSAAQREGWGWGRGSGGGKMRRRCLEVRLSHLVKEGRKCHWLEHPVFPLWTSAGLCLP